MDTDNALCIKDIYEYGKAVLLYMHICIHACPSCIGLKNCSLHKPFVVLRRWPRYPIQVDGN